MTATPDDRLGSTPTDPRPETSARPRRTLRTDARRNRERLVTVARAAFAAEEAVALEGIAQRAGLGIGTLYRHFPTRESLVEAVYAAELDEVVTSATSLLDEFAPDVALRAWMTRYAGFTVTKRGMVDTLRAGWTSGRIPTPGTRERITAAISTLLSAGARTGSLRTDVVPDDVTAMLVGVSLSTAVHPTGDQVERLLDLLLDALRPPASHRDGLRPSG